MIRNNLAKLMIDRGISATQLFNETGIARSTISKISNNNTDKISMQTVDKLCNYLGVTPSEFFDFLPYEVIIKSGFSSFDSLDDVKKKYKDSAGYLEKGWLSISLSKQNQIKHIFEFSLDYSVEYEPSYPLDDGFLPYISAIETQEGVNDDFDIFETMPVQFRKDIVSKVQHTLVEVFDVSPNLQAIQEFDYLLHGIF